MVGTWILAGVSVRCSMDLLPAWKSRAASYTAAKSGFFVSEWATWGKIEDLDSATDEMHGWKADIDVTLPGSLVCAQVDVCLVGSK